MEIKQAVFHSSSVKPDEPVVPAFQEVAFIGRSNVGKSSLINALPKTTIGPHVVYARKNTLNQSFSY